MNHRIKYVTVLIFILCLSVPSWVRTMELKEVYPTLGRQGEPIESFELSGSGFSEDMQLSLSLSRFKTGSVDWTGSARAVATLDTVCSKAYIAAGTDGIRIVDISDSQQPQMIPEPALGENAYVRDIAVSGTRVFVTLGETDTNRRIAALDVSKSPVVTLWTVESSEGEVIHDIAVSGQTLYVAAGDQGLKTLDVDNPDSGLSETPGIPLAYKVTLTNSRIYVAVSDDEVHAFDRSLPPNSGPSLAKINPGLFGSEEILALAAIGDALYVLYSTDDDVRLELFDVNTDGKVTSTFSIKLDGATDICVNPLALMVTCEGSGTNPGEFHIFNLGDSRAPQFDGTYGTEGYLRDMTMAANRAFIVDSDNGLIIADIDDPLHPERRNPHVTLTEKLPDPRAIVVYEEYLYIADNQEGLVIVNGNDPENPEYIGHIDGENAKDIALSGKSLFLLTRKEDGGGLVHQYNVLNPEEPEYHAVLTIDEGSPHSLGLWDESVFVVGSTQLFVFPYNSISEDYPAKPDAINSPTSSGLLSGISISDGYAYIAINDIDQSWLWIVKAMTYADTTNNLIKFAGGAQAVVSQGTKVFVPIVGTWLGSTLAIDVTNPQQPFVYDRIITESNNRQAAISENGSLLFLLNEDVGMIVTHSPTLSDIDDINETGTQSFLSLASPAMEGDYNVGILADGVMHDDLIGAVSFRKNAALFKSKAIIVAGGGPYAPNGIWEETKQCANKAYDALLKQGYHNEDILYLSMECMEQEDTDMVVRWPAALANLRYALTSWVDDETGDLLIYFVDHGEPGSFILNVPLSEDETDITIEKLDVTVLSQWLDQLQEGPVAGRLTFIYDACYSGSFVNGLKSSNGGGRTIIASSAATEKALFGKNENTTGVESFSYHFWSSVYTNGNIGQAFEFASNRMAVYQKALLDFNGNGITNEETDKVSAFDHTLRRGHAMYVIQPGVERITIDPNQDEKTLGITAKGVTDAQWVSAQIVPPDHDPRTTAVNTDFPEVLLEKTIEGVYQGLFDDFSINGTYVVSVRAGQEKEFYSYSGAAAHMQTISSAPLFGYAEQLAGTDSSPGDDYEEDDSPVTAKSIIISDTQPQPHTFHTRNDEDWIRFYGIEKNRYKIETVSLSRIGDTEVTLFKDDGQVIIEGPVNEGGNGDDERMEFNCTESGIYHVRIKNANTCFGSNARYELNVAFPVGPLLSVLISGRVTGPDLAPLPNVLISTDKGGSDISNEQGAFFIRHEEGPVTLTLVSDQYGTMDQLIEVVSGQDNTIDVIFGKKSQASSPSPSSGGGGGSCFISASE